MREIILKSYEANYETSKGNPHGTGWGDGVKADEGSTAMKEAWAIGERIMMLQTRKDLGFSPAGYAARVRGIGHWAHEVDKDRRNLAKSAQDMKKTLTATRETVARLTGERNEWKRHLADKEKLLLTQEATIKRLNRDHAKAIGDKTDDHNSTLKTMTEAHEVVVKGYKGELRNQGDLHEVEILELEKTLKANEAAHAAWVDESEQKQGDCKTSTPATPSNHNLAVAVEHKQKSSPLKTTLTWGGGALAVAAVASTAVFTPLGFLGPAFVNCLSAFPGGAAGFIGMIAGLALLAGLVAAATTICKSHCEGKPSVFAKTPALQEETGTDAVEHTN